MPEAGRHTTPVSIPDRYAKNYDAIHAGAVPALRFQFLIGTLKTTVSTIIRTMKNRVSIPDRYAKNDQLACVSGVAFLGFNS